MSMEEIWKPIIGFENLYMVSNIGRIKALSKWVKFGGRTRFIGEKILKLHYFSNGYAYIDLHKDGAYTRFRVHRLVADHFVPNLYPSTKSTVNHIDENKTNNVASNLEWVTPKENTNHGTAIQRRAEKYKKAVIGTNCKNSNDIIRFGSVREAALSLGNLEYESNIATACRNARKTAYGYRWRYVEKEVMPDAE